jgi:hypothetical protein
MTKLAREYEELVASVARALDPEATVKLGQWIEGPDGQREVDVEVRGTVDGTDHFVLIECKDWKRPVGIGEIDKLDSRRRDLSADTTIIYSNSGFTGDAIRKAGRVGIGAASALAWNDNRVKIAISRQYYAKELRVDSYNVVLYPTDESEQSFPEPWQVCHLYYNGCPVINWLHELSMKLLTEHEGKSHIRVTFAFRRETVFQLEDADVVLEGIRVNMTCSRRWLSQTVQEDVSLGFYNHIKRRVTVPSQQGWSLGPIDREGWQELPEQPEELKERKLEPGTFRFHLTPLRPIPRSEGEDTPNIDELITEGEIEAW